MDWIICILLRRPVENKLLFSSSIWLMWIRVMLRRHSSPVIALSSIYCLIRNLRAAQIFYELLENYKVYVPEDLAFSTLTLLVLFCRTEV